MFDDIFTNLRNWLGLDVQSETDLSETETENADLYSRANVERDYLEVPYVESLSAEGEEQLSWTVTQESPDQYPQFFDYSLPEEPVQGFEPTGDLGNITEFYVPETTWNPAQFDGWGEPIQDAQFWYEQTSPTSCALVAQTSIYESITGEHISEDDICKIAEANGWYDSESGTSPSSVGNVLNALGIPTEQKYDATLLDIADALERGDKVIVSLDANEIWTPLRDSITGEPIEQSDAGHAVWVTGIDQEPDGSVKIIFNDSGNPDGKMNAVDAKDFLNAWHDFGNFVAVAHPSTPSVLA